MDDFRYSLALLLTVFMPPMLLYWFLLHPFVRFWRRLGPRFSFGVVWGLIALGAVGLFSIRDRLLTIDYGFNPVLFGTGLFIIAVSWWLQRRLLSHFRVRTLLGFPELAPDRHPQKLVTTGLHAWVRHPRYVQVLLALLGWSLLANYLAAYVASGLWVPGAWIIVLLEEKELRERFGREYEEYCRRVPRFIPRWGRSADREE